MESQAQQTSVALRSSEEIHLCRHIKCQRQGHRAIHF